MTSPGTLFEEFFLPRVANLPSAAFRQLQCGTSTKLMTALGQTRNNSLRAQRVRFTSAFGRSRNAPEDQWIRRSCRKSLAAGHWSRRCKMRDRLTGSV
jgi:hypothetical protein